MTTKRLIEYLKTFREDTELSVAIFDVKNGVQHLVDDNYWITDDGSPALMILTSKSEQIRRL